MSANIRIDLNTGKILKNQKSLFKTTVTQFSDFYKVHWTDKR